MEVFQLNTIVQGFISEAGHWSSSQDTDSNAWSVSAAETTNNEINNVLDQLDKHQKNLVVEYALLGFLRSDAGKLFKDLILNEEMAIIPVEDTPEGKNKLKKTILGGFD